jgi:hypothetical protein
MKTSSFEWITADVAREMLTHNVGNRRLKSEYVRQIAKKMEEGTWETIGDGISFDEEGNLLTGQHRLSAIVMCGKPQEMLVVRGLKATSKHAHDAGESYAPSDYVAAAGHKNAHAVAAAARLLVYYDRRCADHVYPNAASAEPPLTLPNMKAKGRSHGRGLVVGVLAAYGGVDTVTDSVNIADAAYRSMRKMPASVLTAVHLVLRRANEDEATALFRRIASQTGFVDGDPVLALVKALNGGVTKRPPVELMVLLFKTWNATRRGDKVKLCRWQRTAEGFVFPDGVAIQPLFTD